MPDTPDIRAAIATARIHEILGEGKGFWKSCTGCHEPNEGQPTGPYSDLLKCNLGGGCHECGGIGAVWDGTDYADLGDYFSPEAEIKRAIATVRAAGFKIISALTDEIAWSVCHLMDGRHLEPCLKCPREELFLGEPCIRACRGLAEEAYAAMVAAGEVK